jgi:hypothetical protein
MAGAAAKARACIFSCSSAARSATGIQLALELSAGTACVQTRGLALPMGEMTLPVLGALAGFFGALIVCVRNLAFDSVAAGGSMLFLMFGCGGIGMGAGLFLQSIAAEICRHWH